MSISPKPSFEQLYELADSQDGFFTAKQAASLGYSTRMQTYHVQTGDWEREWRGIYRLRFYPKKRMDDLMIWYLWSSDRSGKPEGVYSHDTALELHELSTWADTRLHIRVPKGFKRRSIPKPLQLHASELRHFEITRVGKLPVTNVVRTFLDLIALNSIQRHHLIEGMQEAKKRGLILPSDFTNKCWSDEERKELKKLEAESQSYVTEA
ncbi:MAG: type IV toxin-antitoxin system AbiEi family antitoxin domain-containing protein [Candidatus Obscuribacterales bacterium]|nr:type IV toxin-antitoxin system AbiEi family antitoxin domain-containing protein [Candidatus Obscuribacterales bacterium]